MLSEEDVVVEVARYLQTKRFGKYRGLVEEVGSGAEFGLIRALVPEVYGRDRTSPWAHPSVPFAGDGHGLVAMPEVGDGVWMEFEAGDPSRPIWTGFWWAEDEAPGEGEPGVRMFATSAGLKLVLDDDGQEIRLENGDDGPSIVMTDSSIVLQVGNKKIEITSDEVNINEGNLTVT